MPPRTYRVGLGLVLGALLLCIPELGRGACSDEAEQSYAKGTQVSRRYTAPGNPCVEACLEEKRFFYQRAVALCPTHVKAHNNLGNAFEKLGRYPEAHAHYTQAVTLQPDFAVAYFGLGDVYFSTGEYSGAIEAYEQGLKKCVDEFMECGRGVDDTANRTVLHPSESRQGQVRGVTTGLG